MHIEAANGGVLQIICSVFSVWTFLTSFQRVNDERKYVFE